MKSPRICLFHTEFAYSGGAEKVIFEQLHYFKKKGYHAVCYTAFIDRNNSFPQLINKYKIKQILPEFLNHFFSNDIMIFLTTLFFPLTVFTYKNFDVFLGENQASTWWAYIASLLWRKPYLTWMTFPTTITYQRGIDRGVRRTSFLVGMIFLILKPLIIKFDIHVMKKAAVSMSCGGYAQQILKKIYKREIIDCPPGIDIGNFNKKIFEAREKGVLTINNLEIKKPFILITNRHVKEKRLDWGIEIIAKLNVKTKNKISFVITGTHTLYTQELQKQIKKLNVGEYVLLPGLVSEEDLIRLYKHAIIYVYTAPEPDYVMGILEAMTYGLPVVAWNKAGPAYIIKDKETGFLITPGDLQTYYKKIQQLLYNKTLRFNMGSKAHEESIKYSWQEHCFTIEKQLLSVV